VKRSHHFVTHDNPGMPAGLNRPHYEGLFLSMYLCAADIPAATLPG
jgi:hypothetical protein